MKVLAVNSSPRPEGQSKTLLVLTPFLEGMREAGAEVELVHLRSKTIKTCIGCNSCLTKHPGTCIHNDDMTKELFPKWRGADLAVYASPLYNRFINGAMKSFIERTYPILDSLLIHGEGGSYSPMRGHHPRIAILSVCGFPEYSNFDQLSAWVHSMYLDPNLPRPILMAEVYRPMSDAMAVPVYREKVEKILEAARQAGREIVTSGRISEETLAKVKQPVTDDPKPFYEMISCLRNTCIAEKVSPREMKERGIRPRPVSLTSFLMFTQMGFNPKTAASRKATLQFNFSGEVEGTCNLTIENGRVAGNLGDTKSADLVIDSPFNVWMDIMTGKSDGQLMLKEKKYTYTGDLSLLQVLRSS